MSSFNSWPVTLMPTTPSPRSIEPVFNSIVGAATNPFTAQMQVFDWGASWMELTVTMPPMTQAEAQPWIDFLISCRGMASVFQISNATWLAQIPAAANVNGYWRLKTNSAKWSVNDGLLTGFSFEIREAI